ncbi:MAG TPA: VWA domain-containing protein [Methanocellaceae archaeon]
MKEIGTFEQLMEFDEIRDVITVPRNIPRRNREEIAFVLFKEIVQGENFEIRDRGRFIQKFGAFYLIFISLKGSEGWERLKLLSRNNQISSLFVLRTVLSKVLELMDEFSSHMPEIRQSLAENVALALEQFAGIVEDTIDLWQRKVTGADVHFNARPGLAEAVDTFQASEISRQFLSNLTQLVLLPDITGAVEEIEDHLASLELLTLLYPGRGWDRSMVELHRTYYANLNKYASLVEYNEDIKKMLELIGRIELEYGARSQGISSHSRSEVYSVTTSRDLEYLLPVESVKLQDETLKYLFFARWMEGKLLTYQLTGKHWAGSQTKRKKGPMIALVDTSGSMTGAPEIVSKAILLAIVRHMLKEKRDMKVFLFSSVGQATEIELTDNRKMASEFLDFLQYTFEGGTDFNTALGEGLKALKDRQYLNADILFITDGLSVVSDERIIEDLNRVKSDNDTRIFTIVIGNDSAGGMEEFSDHTFILSRADQWDLEQSPANAIKLITTR